VKNRVHFTLIEHSYLYCRNEIDKPVQDSTNLALPRDVFDQIESYVLMNSQDTDIAAADYLIPGYVKGKGKVLKARNYVGVLQTKSGITIEILPKIHQSNEITETKKIFLKMLKTLRSSTFKISKFAELDLSNLSLLDIFINMFLDELENLIRQGLRKAYISQAANLSVWRGKLNFNQNIRYNLVHKERFFVEYDEFSADRPENRLIKSTLLMVKTITSSNLLQMRIRRSLFIFDKINSSQNYEKDFAKCKSNGLTCHYNQLLIWCRIFLQNKSFNNYKGNNLAFALMFPMEKIFEDYVAAWLRKQSLSLRMRTQKIVGSLLISPRQYRLKPDIIFGNGEIIADTKWKILDNSLLLSQADLYQMYAYAMKREDKGYSKSDLIILIYPKNEAFTELKEFQFSNERKLIIYPFDLKEVRKNEGLFSEIVN